MAECPYHPGYGPGDCADHISEHDVGVVIGRFQVDEIHPGHIKLLNYVAERHPNMLILLGCRHAPADQKYPLEYSIREEMLRTVITIVHPKILAIFDTSSDTRWSADVDALIRGIYPSRNAILYGGRKSFIDHYTGAFPTHELDFHHDDESGAEIRRRISILQEDHPAFRRGIIYSMMHLQPRLYVTVDIAVVQPSLTKWQVLLGRKKDERQWRFPGGFWNLGDQSAEDAAIRELQEETGLHALRDRMDYLGSLTIDDWRSRGSADVGHKTLFFLVPTFTGRARPGDDLFEVRWVTLSEDCQGQIEFAHLPLWGKLLAHMEGSYAPSK